MEKRRKRSTNQEQEQEVPKEAGRKRSKPAPISTIEDDTNGGIDCLDGSVGYKSRYVVWIKFADAMINRFRQIWCQSIKSWELHDDSDGCELAVKSRIFTASSHPTELP